jgi:hypothetical protein
MYEMAWLKLTCVMIYGNMGCGVSRLGRLDLGLASIFQTNKEEAT